MSSVARYTGESRTTGPRFPGSCSGSVSFARAAFDTPPLGRDEPGSRSNWLSRLSASELSEERFYELEATCTAWAEALGNAIADLGFPVVGASSSFEQTCASLSLLRQVKALRPGTTTMLGGANCEGPMGAALATTGPVPDHLFSGESEDAFVKALEGLAKDEELPRLVASPMRVELDDLPTPDYSDFFTQRERGAWPSGSQIELPLESSRRVLVGGEEPLHVLRSERSRDELPREEPRTGCWTRSATSMNATRVTR